MSLKPLPVQSPPSVVAYQAPPPVQVEAPPVPDITPMRRGRPQPDTSVPHSAATSRNRAAGPSPNVRPTNIDPFAALDKKSAQDEISNRFPSVEQFSLLHDSGNKFQFGDGISPQDQTFDSRVEKLVEDAFSTSASSPPKPAPPPRPSGEFLRQPETVSRGVTGSSGYVRPVVLYEPQPNRPVMVSTGTMTTPSPSESPPQRENIPQNQTLTAVPPTSSNNRITETYVTISRHHTQQPTQQQQHSRPSLLDVGRASTYMSRQPSSSRPSLELLRTPLQPDLLDLNQPIRSKSANSKPRPHSVYVESNLEFLRDLDSPSSQGTSTGGFPPMGGLRMQNSGHSISSVRSDRIDSDVGFLRSLETSESDGYLIHKPERRVSGAGFVAKHVKRASMPSISLPKPGVKNMLGGKFGDAFRRFERGAAGSAGDRARSPSPDMDLSIMSEMSDEWQVSTQDIPPEMKREMEKRQTSMEEKRVAAAAAEYKRQLATRGDVEPGPSRQSRNRANSIQKRVQALLNETKDPPPKTAEGYGRYTVPVEITQLLPPPPPPPLSSSSAVLNGDTRSPVKSESYRITQNSAGYRPSTPVETRGTPAQTVRPGSSGIGSRTTRKPLPPGPTPPTLQSIRPPPPPKPNKLRTGGSNAMSARTSLESVRDVGTVPTTTTADEDWERSFAKRYPSLSGLETVETVVATRKS